MYSIRIVIKVNENQFSETTSFYLYILESSYFSEDTIALLYTTCSTTLHPNGGVIFLDTFFEYRTQHIRIYSMSCLNIKKKT